jgi:hypothetical protein
LDRQDARRLYGMAVTAPIVTANLRAVSSGIGEGQQLGLSLLFAIAALLLHEALFDRPRGDARDEEHEHWTLPRDRRETRAFLGVLSLAVMGGVIATLVSAAA